MSVWGAYVDDADNLDHDYYEVQESIREKRMLEPTQQETEMLKP